MTIAIPRPMRSPSAALCLMLAVACPYTAAAGDDAVPLMRTGHFSLAVDGATDDGARIFLTKRGKPRLLIDAEALGRPLVVAINARRARLVDPAALGGADLGADAIEVPDAALGASGEDSVAVTSIRGGASFVLAGKTLSLGRAEPLLGELSAADLLERLPEYRRNKAAYVPDPVRVETIASVDEPVTVDVVFGSWCPHCEQVVPKLLAVIEAADNSNLTFRFHGVARAFTSDPVARQFRTASLPTVVLTRGPAQVGRLEGAVLDEPETALADVLAAR